MKLINLFLIIPFLSFAQVKKDFPSQVPQSFGLNLAKIFADCPNGFENITEKIKEGFEEAELRDYYTSVALPLADSCFIYETMDETRGIIPIYCSHYGVFKVKKDALKTFLRLVEYLDLEKKSLTGFKKSPLDNSEDEMYQEFRKKLGKETDILLEISLEIDNIQDPKTKKMQDIWEVKLKILEDSSI